MKKLMVLGSVNADHVLTVSQFPKPGETISGHDYRIHDGGKGANQAVAACRLGALTSLIGCVGDDDIGQAMAGRFKEYGIDTEGLVPVSGCKTGTAFIFVDEKGENSIGISPQANAKLTAERVRNKMNLISDASILLLQLETPLEGIELAANAARDSGCTVVLNPAPAAALPDRLLGMVDLITPNQTEAETLTSISVSADDTNSLTRASQVLHRKGIPLVLITLGRRGVWFSDAGQGKLVPGFSVDSVDTTAAGDCFNGALVAALLDGRSMMNAIKFAQAAAALSVTREGAQVSIPYLADVEAFLDLTVPQKNPQCLSEAHRVSERSEVYRE